MKFNNIDKIAFVILFDIAGLVCLFAYKYLIKNEKSNDRIMLKSLGIVTVSSIIGGKILYALTQLATEKTVLEILLNGFVFYGGLIGGLIGILIFCKIYNICYLDITDIYAKLLPLGQAIGRIGCFFNGCCYGREYHGIFAVPYTVNNSKVEVFPTWFVESFICIIIFIYFLRISKKCYRGFYTSRYLIFYSIYRFLIEFLRGDDIRGIWNGISTSQIISIIMLLLGIKISILVAKKKEKLPSIK